MLQQRHTEGIVFLLIGILSFSLVVGGKIKVIEAPFSFNNPLGSNPSSQDQEKKLLSRVDAELPSGPPYLINKLNGVCFFHMENNYKYEFCPFHNVTQREQSYRWNSFHGILGVWKHWSVVNGTFVSMEFLHGDFCVGVQERQTSVILKCGAENKIISVHEPETCKYKMIFKTPYACPTDVFQVYPVLSDDGKLGWKNVESDYANGMLTPSGYKKKIRKLLVNEGLFIEENEEKVKKKKTDPKAITHKTDNDQSSPSIQNDNSGEQEKSVRAITNGFISRHQCVQEYEKLYLEVVSLRRRVKELGNTTVSTGSTSGKRDKAAISNKLIYKRGELGDKSNKTLDKQRISSENNVSKDHRQSLKSMNTSQNGKRGETGFVEEEKYPSRHLQDRTHES